jgi:hypothetical protein
VDSNRKNDGLIVPQKVREGPQDDIRDMTQTSRRGMNTIKRCENKMT